MNYSTIPFKIEMPTNQPFVFDPSSLYARLLTLVDKRDRKGKLYPLAALLTIAVLVKLVGFNKTSDLTEWAKLRAKELSQLFNLKWETMPHQATWGRIFGEAVDLVALETVVANYFKEHLSQQIGERGNLLLNLDGKTLRGSIKPGETRGVHLLAAYLPEYGIVLGQVEVDRKENEIVAAPRLLQQLDLRGMVVSGDAMQTQKNLSVQVVGQGGDYLWYVKENQNELLTDLKLLFEPVSVPKGFSLPADDFKSYKEVDKGHGRVEVREITVSSLVNGYSRWPHLEQVFKLERTIVRGPKTVKETAYGVTSLPRSVASPKRLLELARGHWGIENKLHYRRDVTLQEDYIRLRSGKAQQVNAILNNVVLGLLGVRGITNVASKRRQLDYNPSLALEMILGPVLSRV